MYTPRAQQFIIPGSLAAMRGESARAVYGVYACKTGGADGRLTFMHAGRRWHRRPNIAIIARVYVHFLTV